MVICIANQKGGCGKTTASINLGAGLSFNKKKTLIIDMDPQAHATKGLGVVSDSTLYDVLSPCSVNRKSLAQIIQKVGEDLYCAPSGILLSTLEQELSDEIARESVLKDVLERGDFDRFDFIIIDCPPNLGLLTINALRASNFLIIPVEMSFFSIEGLSQLLSILKLLKERLSCSIDWRILINMFDSRLKHSLKLLEEIKSQFSGRIFDTIIHVNVRLKEAQGEGKHIFSFDKYARGAKDYYALSKELLYLRKDRIWNLNLRMEGVKEIFVVGDFNSWRPSKEFLLLKNKDGSFQGSFSLKPGIYHYRLIIDGKWQEDPTNSRKEANPYGGFNSVLELI